MSQSKFIESTNDYSIDSKYSAHIKKYFNDDFLRYFVQNNGSNGSNGKRKPKIRSPLVNRGYYIRFKCVEFAIQSIDPHVIIYLGSGFDTLSLRYPNVKMIEIDLPQVAETKTQILVEKDLLKGPLEVNQDGPVTLKSGKMSIISGDMRDTITVTQLIKRELRRLVHDLPSNLTICIFNECSLCYMRQEDSDLLIQSLCQMVSDEASSNIHYVGYEQINSFETNSPFCQFMLSHFESMRAPLLTFLTKQQQMTRFKDLGFDHIDVMDVQTFWNEVIDDDEKKRIDGLEPFDEFEEYQLLCNAYALTLAKFSGHDANGDIHQQNERHTTTDTTISHVPLNKNLFFKRFGHCSTLSGDSSHILMFGGFGQSRDTSPTSKLSDVVMFNLDDESLAVCQVDYGTAPSSGRIYSQIVHMRDNKYLLSGGRRSPSELPFGDYMMTRIDDHKFILSVDDISINKTWRHSVIRLDSGTLVKFGGRTSPDIKDDNTFYTLNTVGHDVEWCKRRTDVNSDRHSAGAVSIEANSFVVSGGLTSDSNKAINDIRMIDLRADKSVELKGDCLPEGLFSHQMIRISDKSFAVLGGIWDKGSNNSLMIYDVRNQSLASSYKLQFPHVVMLHNFTCEFDARSNSIVTFGGAGNCFTFGSHFNHDIFRIKVA